MIMESGYLEATDTDVLNAPSRLAAIPYSGMLTLEFQATVADNTNHFDLTLQLPNGDVPIDGQMLPEGSNVGSLDANEKYVVSFPVAQGGHVVVNLTETGTSTVFWRATLMP